MGREQKVGSSAIASEIERCVVCNSEGWVWTGSCRSFQQLTAYRSMCVPSDAICGEGLRDPHLLESGSS